MTDPESLLARYRPIGPPSSLRLQALPLPRRRHSALLPRLSLAICCLSLVLYGFACRTESQLLRTMQEPGVPVPAPEVIEPQ